MGGTYTPNLHLYKPLKGEVGWDAAVNANFDTLDSTIEALEVQVGGLVTSVFGRTGAVVSQTGDYSFSQISGKAGLAQGGTNADLSGTGGASQVLKQVSAGAPITVGQLAVSDISGISAIAGSGAWSALQNASANLTLSNAGFTTEFDQTSAASWKWKNTTTATSGTTNASPPHLLAANYWTGAASAEDSWTLQSTLAAGTNGIPNLSITHSGSTGVAQIKAPAVIGIYGWAGGLGGVGPGGGGNTNQVGISIGGTETFRFTGSYLNMGPSGIAWAATLGTPDTGLYRLGAASLGIGNGTAGDFSGALTLGALNQTNPTVATSGTTNASPIQTYSANYWTGAASAVDTWTVQSSLAAGTSGASTLIFGHTGSAGAIGVQVPILIAGIGSSSTKCISLCSSAGTEFSSIAINGSSDFTFWTSSIAVQPSIGIGSFGGTNPYLNQIVLGHVNTLTHTSGQPRSVAIGGAGVASGVPQITFAPTSGNATYVCLQVSPTINSTGTTSGGKYTALLVNVVETSLTGLSGNRLLDLQAGTTGGTSKFSIDNTGAMFLTAAAGAPTSAGTAGTAGQVIYNGGLLYFCSASGAAGSATWNKLTMTAV